MARTSFAHSRIKCKQENAIGKTLALRCKQKDVVDKMEELDEATGQNGGFILAKGELRDFVDYVVPELQRRGLTKTEYTGKTLRENLNWNDPREAAISRVFARLPHSARARRSARIVRRPFSAL